MKKVYEVTCPECGYTVKRSKLEAAGHVMAQHVAYTHSAPVVADPAAWQAVARSIR